MVCKLSSLKQYQKNHYCSALPRTYPNWYSTKQGGDEFSGEENDEVAAADLAAENEAMQAEVEAMENAIQEMDQENAQLQYDDYRFLQSGARLKLCALQSRGGGTEQPVGTDVARQQARVE